MKYEINKSDMTTEFVSTNAESAVQIKAVIDDLNKIPNGDLIIQSNMFTTVEGNQPYATLEVLNEFVDLVSKVLLVE